MDRLEERSDEMEFTDFLEMQDKLAKQLISYDKQIQTKRKMLFDIEKENVMTIASALRSIPKTPEKKNNALKERKWLRMEEHMLTRNGVSAKNVGYAPVYVKKQCESWLAIADGDDPDAFVDEKAYEKICKLLKLMVHPDLRCSIYDGLEDYAWLFIVATLCTKIRNTEQDIRFYTTAVLEIARKNFKTFNSAIIFILLC